MANDSNASGSSISIIARRFGVSTTAIRKLEERGLVHPDRTAGGWRVYPEGEVRKIERYFEKRAGAGR